MNKKKRKSIYLEIMSNFDEKNIPNLDVCVMAAIDLLRKSKIVKLKIPKDKSLIVGSGNAITIGKILFKDKDSLFATESDFLLKLKKIKDIKNVIVVSASGGKHAPLIAKISKSMKKKVFLITNTKNSLTEKYCDKVFVYPKNREPYTYNTSTYMSMIYGKTKEDLNLIKKTLEKYDKKLEKINFEKYRKYFFVIPNELEEMGNLFHVKFKELFGRNVSRDIETYESIKHATTVVPSKELFVYFGIKERKKEMFFGENKFFVELPYEKEVMLMAVVYLLIGNIQKKLPQWFKKNIKSYVKNISKLFKQKIDVIVN